MKFKGILFLIPVLMVLISFTGVASDNIPAKIKDDINQGNNKWIKAFQTGDAELFSSIFIEDGMILSRGGNVLAGQEKIRTSMEETMKKMGKVETTIKTLEIWKIANEVYETGKYTYTFIHPETGKEIKTSGKYLVIWKEENGIWKIAKDIGIPD